MDFAQGDRCSKLRHQIMISEWSADIACVLLGVFNMTADLTSYATFANKHNGSGVTIEKGTAFDTQNLVICQK